MRWTRAALLTRALACGRRSRVVLAPRRWRQVLEKQASCKFLGGDGGKQARSPGRARNKPLKPLRAGMPGDPGATVVTNACAFYHCARGCGCNGHPAFPTPSLGGSTTNNSGAIRRGNVKLYLAVFARSTRISASRCPSTGSATKQSTLASLLPHGLLRGACHRARIRATGWLAMTISKRLARWLFENRISKPG
jgi:hypothetical protein